LSNFIRLYNNCVHPICITVNAERERLTLVQPSNHRGYHRELQPFSRDFHSLRTAQHSGVIKELQVIVCNRVQRCYVRLVIATWHCWALLHDRTGCRGLSLSSVIRCTSGSAEQWLKFLEQSAENIFLP